MVQMYGSTCSKRHGKLSRFSGWKYWGKLRKKKATQSDNCDYLAAFMNDDAVRDITGDPQAEKFFSCLSQLPKMEIRNGATLAGHPVVENRAGAESGAESSGRGKIDCQIAILEPGRLGTPSGETQERAD